MISNKKALFDGIAHSKNEIIEVQDIVQSIRGSGWGLVSSAGDPEMRQSEGLALSFSTIRRTRV